MKSVAAFTTAGGMDKTEKIASIVRAQGILAREETLPLKLALRNHATFVKKGHITLSAKELQSIEDFVKKTMA